MNLYFSDFFKVDPKIIEEYGAFDISLIFDLPLFIDPFLLFNSKKDDYKELHEKIIDYLKFLKDKSVNGSLDSGALKTWYLFQEVEQNWFGFSLKGNKGSGLGMDFATALNENLYKIFSKFGEEDITKGSHLEKLCLIKDGIGKDNISDFATNLIKDFLLEYTETFTKKYIDPALTKKFRVKKAKFNYKTETWEEGIYQLPKHEDNFVLLTPKELLTKDDTWINKTDLIKDFENIPDSISDDQLRFQINNYFKSQLTNEPNKEPTKKEKIKATFATLQEFPDLIDFFIKYKEDNGERAESISDEKVKFSSNVYVENVKKIIPELSKIGFYTSYKEFSYDEAHTQILNLKDFIENNDGYRLFYDNNDNVIRSEKELQLLFALVCKNSIFDVNREPNNGRGPVDFAISMGRSDKTLIEFKLAKNTSLKKNLQKQVEIYQNANGTDKAFKVIIYFTEKEQERVYKILRVLNLNNESNIVLIDARIDNKPSASNA
ncbi:MAG: hypothetical protein ABIH87_03355 [bacterium]